VLLRRSLVAAALALTVAVPACSSGRIPTGADVGLAPGTRLFAAPPPTPDCSRIDTAALGALTVADVPPARRLLTYADPARPKVTWAACAGVAETASASSSGSAAGEATREQGAVTGSADVLHPTREGAAGPAAWLVRYATSAAAGRTRPLLNPHPGDGGYRTLVRPASLGDAPARVELSVRADTHLTLVLVSVFDPGTGRNGAECGIGEVPGPAVDAAVAWCLRAVAGQLVGRPSVPRATVTARPAAPSPSVSPRTTSSG
jgi:hypothetical protein